MRRMIGIAGIACLLVIGTSIEAAEIGLGGGVGNGVSVNAARDAANAASQFRSRASVRVGQNVGVDAQRHVGANFAADRTGVRGGVKSRGRLSAGAGGIGIGASGHGEAAAHIGRRPDSPNRPDQPGSNRSTDPREQGHNHVALQADLLLAQRLAQIDRLRDVALANGDTDLLLRADTLEQQARLQHRHRIESALGAQLPPPPQHDHQFTGQAAGEFQGRAGANAPNFDAQSAGQFDADGAAQFDRPSNFTPNPHVDQAQLRGQFGTANTGQIGYQGREAVQSHVQQAQMRGEFGQSVAGQAGYAAQGYANPQQFAPPQVTQPQFAAPQYGVQTNGAYGVQTTSGAALQGQQPNGRVFNNTHAQGTFEGAATGQVPYQGNPYVGSLPGAIAEQQQFHGQAQHQGQAAANGLFRGNPAATRGFGAGVDQQNHMQGQGTFQYGPPTGQIPANGALNYQGQLQSQQNVNVRGRNGRDRQPEGPGDGDATQSTPGGPQAPPTAPTADSPSETQPAPNADEPASGPTAPDNGRN